MPDSNPSPSQTEYAVESGRMQAANIDAFSNPALNSRYAYGPNGFSACAASFALSRSVGLSWYAPAHATMMKNAITEVRMQPTTTSTRDSPYSLVVIPFSTTAACW